MSPPPSPLRPLWLPILGSHRPLGGDPEDVKPAERSPCPPRQPRPAVDVGPGGVTTALHGVSLLVVGWGLDTVITNGGPVTNLAQTRKTEVPFLPKAASVSSLREQPFCTRETLSSLASHLVRKHRAGFRQRLDSMKCLPLGIPTLPVDERTALAFPLLENISPVLTHTISLFPNSGLSCVTGGSPRHGRMFQGTGTLPELTRLPCVGHPPSQNSEFPGW